MFRSTDVTAQKMKFSITDFFSKCDQIRRKLRIWSHLLTKSVMENFIFCALCQICIQHLESVLSANFQVNLTKFVFIKLNLN